MPKISAAAALHRFEQALVPVRTVAGSDESWAQYAATVLPAALDPVKATAIRQGFDAGYSAAMDRVRGLLLTVQGEALQDSSPTGLEELAAAWDAYRENDDYYDRLADTIRVVLGREKSPERLAMDAAQTVSIMDLPKNDRGFGFISEVQQLGSTAILRNGEVIGVLSSTDDRWKVASRDRAEFPVYDSKDAARAALVAWVLAGKEPGDA